MMVKHGVYWNIALDQDTEGLFMAMGKPKPDGDFVIPLRTIEAPAPFDETEERSEAVRYFRKAKPGDNIAFWTELRKAVRQ